MELPAREHLTGLSRDTSPPQMPQPRAAPALPAPMAQEPPLMWVNLVGRTGHMLSYVLDLLDDF